MWLVVIVLDNADLDECIEKARNWKFYFEKEKKF